MNALVANPTTGFLESQSNYGTNFTSEKKLQLLEEAERYRKETGKWPDLDSLCKAAGIQPITFERHLRQDRKFAEAWRNLTLGGKWKLESLMFDMSAKNPMYMFGWLRKHFPEEYNPDYKVTIQADASISKRLLEDSQVYDAEIVPPNEAL